VTDLVHPSLDELSELREGVLDGTRREEVSTHLAACEHCSTQMAALAQVQTILAAAGRVPTPASVSACLDEALERAGRERAADVASLTERRTRRQGRPTRGVPLPRWIAAAAGAAAAVVVLGYAGVSLLNNSGGSDSSATEPDAGGRAATPHGAAGTASGGIAQSLGSKAPADVSPQVVTPRTLGGYASRLAGTHRYLAATTSCGVGVVHVPPDSRVAPIRWKGATALVVVDPTRRRASVYACRDAAILFSARY
jgi:anti-sigma factor RsiW